jgi:hypothetical protein
MTTYRVATGHDVALGSLTVLSPQPDPGNGIQVTRRTYGSDNTVSDQGRYIEFTWSAYTNSTDYATLLALFGLNASTSTAAVTVYVRDEIYAWVRMNGYAVRPIPGETVRWGDNQSRPLDIVILVKDLETAA